MKFARITRAWFTCYVNPGERLEFFYRRRQLLRAQECTTFRVYRRQIAVLRQIILQHSKETPFNIHTYVILRLIYLHALSCAVV